MRLISNLPSIRRRTRTASRPSTVKPVRGKEPPPPKSKTSNTRFKVTTLIQRFLGKDTQTQAMGCIRVLPARVRNTVVLQATDGAQAVCLLVPGQATSTELVPPAVLPRSKADLPSEVCRTSDGWHSTSGRQAPPCDRTAFPPVGSALPDLEGEPSVTLSLDTALLQKLAAAFGTTQLHLIIPTPERGQLTRWRSDRPSRSGFQTTNTSLERNALRHASRPGRSPRPPLMLSV